MQRRFVAGTPASTGFPEKPADAGMIEEVTGHLIDGARPLAFSEAETTVALFDQPS
jgi:hypothetical protein